MGDFNNFNDSFNEQPPYLIEPVTLVDQVSSTEFYIGISNNGSDTSRPIWRIKKIWQDNTCGRRSRHSRNISGCKSPERGRQSRNHYTWRKD